MRSACGLLACLTLALTAVGETNDIYVARQALRDGLWEIARSHAVGLATDESRLIVLESLAGEGKWGEIAKLLDGWKEAKGAGFDYYRAIVRGDHAAAMKILKEGGSYEGRVEAALFEAGELAKAGKREEAERIWRELAAATNVSKRVFVLASVNLGDVPLLRKAHEEAESVSLRRMVGLRLGRVLLKKPETEAEGAVLIRAVISDSPDAEGGREALIDVANAALAAGRWKEAYETYHAAIEIWPDVVRNPAVQEGRGWALLKLGRRDEAMEAFRRLGALSDNPETKARALVKEGDILQESGNEDAAMARYREVLEKHAETSVAQALKKVVGVRELEKRGKDLYRSFKFAEASDVFGQVAKADPARKPMMDFFAVLCLYGQGRDDEACAQARQIVDSPTDSPVRQDAALWLAKFLFNRREWKESGSLFVSSAGKSQDGAKAAEALLWAARAAFAANDFNGAIQLSTQVVERHADAPSRVQALLVQGEALIELARFDEAALVFERVAVSENAGSSDRLRARMLKADALYAMGADNPSRYVAAAEAYRAVRFNGDLAPSERIVVSFKIARTLEKLKRIDEAVDTYYSQVVLAYREERLSMRHLTEEARAAFSRAAFRLADEFESRGKDRQAINVLRLVFESDVPASDEAGKRLEKLSNKGR